MNLVEAPLLQPSEVNIDQNQMLEMQKELEEAQNMELPEDEDGF